MRGKMKRKDWRYLKKHRTQGKVSRKTKKRMGISALLIHKEWDRFAHATQPGGQTEEWDYTVGFTDDELGGW
ncbi:hypothetical protein GCM10008014_08620 [Paenibacillus silvae]|uniref:Uncharacterized protein n=1 Tax=Paenibacillus silvae TaxID=1325358 RepID=A0ABQ1Z3L1_9BACL|nr:hypothetical protein [Paenibacillus silvae]GGH46150.1 hypothetical protein GCM10008014_08620 [Paenibacillus silvae]